jgi:release factor glutamine methyltransferase
VSSLTGVRRRSNTLLMRAYGPWAIRHVERQHAYRWRGLTMIVPTGVFHPGLFFSSAVLANEIEQRNPIGRSVLDVGCGSGLLTLVAARAGAAVTAVDINPEAVRATSANAAANGLAAEVLESDLFAALVGRRFDLVVVNPPYFAKDPIDDAERAWFAGADLGYFEQFFAGLGDRLVVGKRPGRALMVLSEGCDMAVITAAATRHGFRMGVTSRTRVWLGLQVVWVIEHARTA